MKKIVGCIKKAVEEFNMIEEGDIVGVGVSGGKDSSALLYALRLYQNFSKVKFQIKALTLTLGFDNFDLSPVSDFCKEIGVEHVVVTTEIGKIIFEDRKEKNPCSLCARMRRGRLHNLCKELGVTKLALGHHADDAMQTLFLSMFYEGRLNTFEPVTYLDRKDLTMIRPLMFAYEDDIIKAVKKHNIPVVESPCPANKKTQREYAKDLIDTIQKDIPNVKSNLVRALQNKDQMYLWFK